MSANILKSLSMKKYERLLPRLFPGVARTRIRDQQGELFWDWSRDAARSRMPQPDDNPAVAWSEFGSGIEKRQLPCWPSAVSARRWR